MATTLIPVQSDPAVAGALNAIDDVDTHLVIMLPHPPTRLAADTAMLPACPAIVTSVLPVPAMLLRTVLSTDNPSLVIDLVNVDRCRPDPAVPATLHASLDPACPLTCIDVHDTHTVLSSALPPIRPPTLAEMHPIPTTVTDIAPVSAPFVLTTLDPNSTESTVIDPVCVVAVARVIVAAAAIIAPVP